jgi:hypothetical protein
MSVATAFVVLAGLGIVLSFVQDMASQPTSMDLAKMILVFGMMMISAISGLLVWQIARLLSLPRQTSTLLQPQRPTRASAPPLVAAPSASVTEHTTRNFDPSLYREPSADE